MRVTLAGLSSQYIHVTLAPWCLRHAARKAGRPEEITLCEMNINEPAEQLMRQLMETRPDLLGFSVYIWNRSLTGALIRRIKAAFPALPILVGGPEVTWSPEETFREMPCDFLLRGAGEESFPLLLSALQGEIPLEQVPGLCRRTSDGVYISPEVAPAPPPDPGVYDDAYLAALKGRMAYVETSRGCPFSCAFCLSGQRDKVLFLPKEEALALLLRVGKSGVSIVKLIDRTFNCDRKRTAYLLSGLMEARKRGELGQVCYHLEVGADLFDGELLALLREAPAGLFQLEAGIQSFHGPTLEHCRRRTDMALLESNLRALLAPGNIHIHIDLIAGLPEEDLPTFITSFNKAYALGPHMLQLGFLKLLYGSALREEAEANACRFSPDPPYEVLSTRWLSYEDLCQLKDVEQAIERLYNSGKFQRTLAWALPRTGLTPYAFYLAMGRRMAEVPGKLSHERLTELLYAYLTQAGLPGEQLRDCLVLDRLATDNTGYLPPLLQRDPAGVKAAARRYREQHPEARRARFALVEGGATLLVADWEETHPVTRLGQVQTLKNP